MATARQGKAAAPAADYTKSTAREYFESICVAVILALFVRTFVVQAFKIPTGSMENNLLIGDHLLVNKFVFGPTATGLERALRTPEHFRRCVGRTVRLSAREGDAASVVEGVLIAADDAGATVATTAGERTVAYPAIASARTTFVWGTAARR